MLNITRHPPTLIARTTPGHDHDLATLRCHLVRAAAARQTQLLELRPIKAGDTGALAHHARVRRIFDEIHAAP